MPHVSKRTLGAKRLHREVLTVQSGELARINDIRLRDGHPAFPDVAEALQLLSCARDGGTPALSAQVIALLVGHPDERVVVATLDAVPEGALGDAAAASLEDRLWRDGGPSDVLWPPITRSAQFARERIGDEHVCETLIAALDTAVIGFSIRSRGLTAVETRALLLGCDGRQVAKAVAEETKRVNLLLEPRVLDYFGEDLGSILRLNPRARRGGAFVAQFLAASLRELETRTAEGDRRAMCILQTLAEFQVLRASMLDRRLNVGSAALTHIAKLLGSRGAEALLHLMRRQACVGARGAMFGMWYLLRVALAAFEREPESLLPCDLHPLLTHSDPDVVERAVALATHVGVVDIG